LRQHLAIGLATVTTHDGSQRRVGFHRRAVDADPLALHKTVLGDKVQNPAEDFLMYPVRQPRARLRQPGVIGNLVPVRKPQEIPQRKGIRTPPSDATLAVDPLEIADHVHPEIPSRRQRRSPHARRVERLARRLDEGVEAGLGQHLLQPVVEGVSRRTRHLSPGHDQVALNTRLASHRHRRNLARIFKGPC
jgi:hypothetical protein